MVLAIAGLVVGLLGVVAAVVTYLLSRRPKCLGWVIVKLTDLVREQYPEIVVTHRRQILQNPVLVELRFLNYGKVEIRRGDFDPSEVWGAKVKSHTIVDASVASEAEGEVRTGITVRNSDQIVLEPVLLNPGESVRIAMLLDVGEHPSGLVYHVTGRIAGVRKFANLDTPTPSIISAIPPTLARPIFLGSVVVGTSLYALGVEVFKSGWVAALGFIIAFGPFGAWKGTDAILALRDERRRG